MQVISISFVEVDQQKTEPQSYALSYPNGRLPFDYVWFTPRVDDEDPCEKFKSQLDRMKNNIRFYAEQAGAKGPLPDLAKYVDQSYLRQAQRELDRN